MIFQLDRQKQATKIFVVCFYIFIYPLIEIFPVNKKIIASTAKAQTTAITIFSRIVIWCLSSFEAI